MNPAADNRNRKSVMSLVWGACPVVLFHSKNITTLLLHTSTAELQLYNYTPICSDLQ